MTGFRRCETNEPLQIELPQLTPVRKVLLDQFRHQFVRMAGAAPTAVVETSMGTNGNNILG
jgi:hypothetical protein